MARQLTALAGDVFAGLFTAGVKQAGFRVLATLEHSDYGAKTARLNHPEVEQHLKLADWGATGPAARYAGKVDFMFTNPPCALWSQARGRGMTAWQAPDPRLSWAPDLIDAGLVIRPKAWCWESVTNAWRHGRSFVLEQGQKWANAGYSVTLLLQNNQYLGVPQVRPRMFLIAHQHPLVWPALTEPITVAQAFKGLKVKEGEKQYLDPQLKMLWEAAGKGRDLFHAFHGLHEDEQAKFRAETGRGAPSFLVKKLVLDRPSKVILGGLKTLHPTEPRYLTYGEYLRLCGAPLDWQSSSASLSTTTAELSRAVMAPVGRWLGLAVADGLAKPKLRKPAFQLVDMSKGPEHVTTEDLW
jgi:site-specific DNA-cytosine methylase